MGKRTESEELAFRLRCGIHDDLGPQIKKLRFIQRLSMKVGPSFADAVETEIDGLVLILDEVINAYDRVESLIPKPVLDG